MQSVGFNSTEHFWRVDPRNPEAEVIARAASVLRESGVIVYPTETFYALGAHPMLKSAVERIYQIKGREFKKPLPLIAAGLRAAKDATAQWPPVAERLARAFWPGPLTLVLPVAPHLPSLVHAHTGKIAVRVSSHPVAQALSAAAGGLLISTSANLAERAAAKDPQELPPAFLARVDALLHAGTLPGNLPSTIVDVSSDPPRLIRTGCISWEEIEAVSGEG